MLDIVFRIGKMLMRKIVKNFGFRIDILVCVRECMSMCLGVVFGDINKVYGVEICKVL